MDSDNKQEESPGFESVTLESLDLKDRPIWHDDGDIVLKATANGVKKYFRVHRIYLRRTSDVFRDMFSIAQPADREGSCIEGCPIIPLDDSPEDLYALLNAIYDGLAMLRTDCLDLDTALSILLLSDKYGMEGLREGIIRVLQEDWPLNRTDYINRRKLLDLTGFRVDQSIKVIKAARRSNVSELLPTAFYELALGVGGIELLSPSAFNELSSNDLSRLLVGSKLSVQRLRKLGEGGMQYLWNPIGEPVDIFTHRQTFPRCTTNRRDDDAICKDFRSSFQSKVGTRLLNGNFAVGIARVLQKQKSWSSDLCENCSQWAASIMQNKEKEIWENIPADFGLPPIDRKHYSESMFKMR